MQSTHQPVYGSRQAMHALVFSGIYLIAGICHAQETDAPRREPIAPVLTQATAVPANSDPQLTLSPSDATEEQILYGTALEDLPGIVTEAPIFDPISTDLPIEIVSKPATTTEENILFGDWLGYNAVEDDTTWLPASGDGLGIFSLQSYPTLPIGDDGSIETGMGFHFLNGPIVTDLPPRLFDFEIAVHQRFSRTENFVLDVKYGVGVFSDFEGSARKGVRFPGHAVGYYQWHPWLVSVLGIESLDRDDVSAVPVVGFVWRPRPDVVFDVIFPRPKLQVKINDGSFFVLSGELGGGTWAIERSDSTNDVATYRDFRILAGWMDSSDGDASGLEMGWAFGRALEYRSGNGNFHPDDSFILRLRTLY